LQRPDIQDGLSLVEREQRLSNSRFQCTGVDRCPHDQVSEVRGTLLVGLIDYGAVIVSQEISGPRSVLPGTTRGIRRCWPIASAFGKYRLARRSFTTMTGTPLPSSPAARQRA